jgi:hypothetical protein
MHEDMEDRVPYLAMDLVDVVTCDWNIYLLTSFMPKAIKPSLLQNSIKGYNILLPPTLLYNLCQLCTKVTFVRATRSNFLKTLKKKVSTFQCTHDEWCVWTENKFSLYSWAIATNDHKLCTNHQHVIYYLLT